MRQIVSLIKDNQVHYALVDDDQGELVPFADLLLPDPDRFGLHDAAVLGTNLITALGLNGRRPKAAQAKIATAPEPEALPPSPRKETARERRNRLEREQYHARPKPKTKAGAERFITLDEVMAVINRYPEGITTRQIANIIFRQDGGTSDAPGWYLQAIGNRQTNAELVLKKKGTPLPYRIEYRAKIGANGLPTKVQEKYLLPGASGTEQIVSTHETGVSSDA